MRKCSHHECKVSLPHFKKNITSRFCKKHRMYSTTQRYKSLKSSARKRRLSANLSFQDFLTLIKKGCYYCNADLMVMTGSGLDRINNKFGYSIKNTIPCCPTCNLVRGSYFTVEEFKKCIDFLIKLRDNKKQLWPKFVGTTKHRRRRKNGV